MKGISKSKRQIDVIRQEEAPLYFIRIVDGEFKPQNIQGIWISVQEATTLIIKLNNALLMEV